MNKIIALFLLLSSSLSCAATTTWQTDTAKLGRLNSNNKDFIFDLNMGSANPRLRANGSTNKIQFANNGVSFQDVGSGTGSTVQQTITQTAHGFSVGNVVYYNGTAYAKAKADAASTSQAVGVVSVVPNANSFTLVSDGYVSGLSGLTAGVTYYLSGATAGLLTATAPTDVANKHSVLGVLVADSTTSGYMMKPLAALAVPNYITESIFFAGATDALGCTSSPCTIHLQSGSWASSVTRNGTGDYTVNVASGIFSSIPICTCNADTATAGTDTCTLERSTSSTTAIHVKLFTVTVGPVDTGVTLICHGPR